ncbi:MAG: SMI1/KNR4 family protein [Thermoanaerobaculia bacterium]
MKDMESAFAECDVAGPATEAMVSDAEHTLGVTFPPTYRAFLRRYGAVQGRGFWIAGLASRSESNQPYWSDLVTDTLSARASGNGLIPPSYVAIADDGGDYTFFLDTSVVDSRGECPIIAMGPGVDALVIAPDFAEFAVKLAKDEIVF